MYDKLVIDLRDRYKDFYDELEERSKNEGILLEKNPLLSTF